MIAPAYQPPIETGEDRRMAILRLFAQAEAERRPAPSVEEICGALGLASKSSGFSHLQVLVRAQLLEPAGGHSRSYRLTPEVRREYAARDFEAWAGRYDWSGEEPKRVVAHAAFMAGRGLAS